MIESIILVAALALWAVIVGWALVDAAKQEERRKMRTNHGRDLDMARKKKDRLP